MKRKIIDYKTVSVSSFMGNRPSLTDIQEAVKEYIKEGWCPHGSISVSQGGFGAGKLYAQAMVKYEQPPKPPKLWGTNRERIYKELKKFGGLIREKQGDKGETFIYSTNRNETLQFVLTESQKEKDKIILKNRE